MNNRMEITFGTSNLHKVAEAKSILEPFGFVINHFNIDLLEIQDSDLERIAKVSLENLELEGPVFVEDTGLFVEELKGFPGPFASYVFETVGNVGILNLLENVDNRNAFFESFIAYKDKYKRIFTFKGRCEGQISEVIQGTEWGYDPIFIPNSKNPDKLTFAELGDDIKNNISHRSLALKSFKDFLVKK